MQMLQLSNIKVFQMWFSYGINPAFDSRLSYIQGCVCGALAYKTAGTRRCGRAARLLLFMKFILS
ncbi:hypothetical protein POPTR_001G410554v4 [Populus trichocarpa]|uniref:Uncharacterized protein n=1 Tax=Populus trichocarpa TaxID=3694 RepID=A0ACC0TPA3_POPTR|nr:hypothetical protein BDE02_01G365000 [Populus trichocarpa]KAI9403382.1 hypothetical protein POPTR_001G410554v4 [Populus trichocarpa]